jgi:hypothetical protein
MYDEDGIRVQFVYLPSEGVQGILIEETPYYCIVEWSALGILHREIFDQDDIIYTKEIIIPIELEGDGK